MSKKTSMDSPSSGRPSAKSRGFRRASQAKFLKALAITKTVGAAASKAKISRQTHKDWLETDPAYLPRFKEVEEELADEIEEKVRERAFHGTDEPIVRKGEITWVKKPSDRLLELLWKVKCPELFVKKVPVPLHPSSDLTVAEAELIDNFTDEELGEWRRANGVIIRLLRGNESEGPERIEPK